MASGNDSFRDDRLMTSRVLIVFDATKDHSNHEIRRTVNNIRMRGGIVHPGDTITVVGVLHKILHPSKLICTVSSRLHLNGMIWGKDFESILTNPPTCGLNGLWIDLKSFPQINQMQS